MTASKHFDISGVGQVVQLGRRGAKMRDQGGIIEARNPANNAYARIRGDHPVNDNDLVTKRFLETRAAVSITKQIMGGSGSLPAATEGEIALVTKTGDISSVTYTENELWRYESAVWDKIFGVSEIPDGLRVTVTDALSGGDTTYQADHVYIWNKGGSVWADVGPSSAETRLVKSIRSAIAWNTTGAGMQIDGAGLGDSDTTILYTSLTGALPEGVSFVVMIEAEQILCSGKTGTNLLVSPGGRGYNGTTPAAHASGTAIMLTAIGFNNPCPANGRATEIVINVTEAFNGDTTATLSAGIITALTELAGTELSDLGSVDSYRIDCYKQYNTATELLMAFTPSTGGTVTAGAATIELIYTTA